ncbi:MAG: phosphate signaling complex protein PhoU [Clostridia bacterium]|nr:phosphate signaling complex protein PhoU [Clostridia bacterium]
MRSRFDEQLNDLSRELIAMGSLCEQAIDLAARALFDGDLVAAAEVSRLEEEIDHAERGIESLCLRLLLQQQPVARDLRLISAALKMITDMERIGDQAEDISEIVKTLGGKVSGGVELIGDMSRAVTKMVTASVDAFVKQDVALAANVIAYDDVVDGLFDRVKNYLIDTIGTGAENGEYAVDILMIAKYFERIGDHATNIAEWVVFAVTGVHKGEAEP